jgi:hypothetical protein
MCPGEARAVLQISAERRRATVPVPAHHHSAALEAAAPSSKTKLWLLTNAPYWYAEQDRVRTIAHDRGSFERVVFDTRAPFGTRAHTKQKTPWEMLKQPSCVTTSPTIQVDWCGRIMF